MMHLQAHTSTFTHSQPPIFSSIHFSPFPTIFKLLDVFLNTQTCFIAQSNNLQHHYMFLPSHTHFQALPHIFEPFIPDFINFYFPSPLSNLRTHFLNNWTCSKAYSNVLEHHYTSTNSVTCFRILLCIFHPFLHPFRYFDHSQLIFHHLDHFFHHIQAMILTLTFP